MQSQQNLWLKYLVDFGPLAAFFISFKLWDVFIATSVLIVVTGILTAIGYMATRKIAAMPVVTLIVVVIFGGLTIWLKDDTFIKMKPTIVMGLFSAILFGGLLLGRPMVKYVMSAALTLDDQGWRKLTLRFACFFAVVALLNEIVWRTQTTDVWVNFKVFGIIGLNFLFILMQIPLIRRHQVESSS